MNTANLTKKLLKILNQEKNPIWLWMPIFFACGIIFFFEFFNSDAKEIFFAASLLLIAVLLFYFDRFSYRSFIYLVSGLMLLGFIWSFFYQKFFVMDYQLSGKVYADVKGKVTDIKEFSNPINGHGGLNLVISDPILYKSQFVKKEIKNSKEVKKKVKKPNKKSVKKISRKPSKKFLKLAAECGEDALCLKNLEEKYAAQKAARKLKKEQKKLAEISGEIPEKKMTKKFLKLFSECGENEACQNEVKKSFSDHEEAKKLRREERKKQKQELAQKNLENSRICNDENPCPEILQNNFEKVKKQLKKTHKKPKKISEKQIEKNFLNLPNYQEIDREFLDISKNYQPVSWLKKGDYQIFPNPPKKISILSYSTIPNLKIGDIIFLRTAIGPPQQREFIYEFDYALNAQSKGIGGFGHAMSKGVILQKSQTSVSLASYFEDFIGNLRKKIESKITSQISGDEGAIAAALMMGSQNLISNERMLEIRNSGLAHLLSISGLHMAIAAAIFFTLTRFLLSRSEYLTLHFNIKKIAAFAAIFSAYFYLELAASPVPAIRSFVMVALVLMAVMIDRKTDAKRCIALAAFGLMIFNPYNIFSISFQLSFAAILSLACFHEFFLKAKPKFKQDSAFQKFLWYFLEIAFASVIVQIATMPFLIYHFRNFSTYGLVSNMLAIPLTTFVTMPLGFLAVFLMPLGLEKLPLQAMSLSISWVIDIARFVSNLDYSYFVTPQMPKFAFAFASFGWLILCLMNSRLRWFGGLILGLSFTSLCFVKQPNLLFDGQQKFFAIYDEKDGLVFSEKMRPSKKRDLWMKEMNETKFKYFGEFSDEWHAEKGIKCDEKKCQIDKGDQKILVLLARNKLSEICLDDATVIVNLASKYQLPTCFAKKKIKIDNLDFYQKGGHFLYFQEEKSGSKKTEEDIIIKTAREI